MNTNHQKLKEQIIAVAQKYWLTIEEPLLAHLVAKWLEWQAIIDVINGIDTDDIDIKSHVSYLKNNYLATDDDLSPINQSLALKTVKNKLQPNGQVRYKNEV